MAYKKKVIRIGRIAGQYAKPRSEALEKDNQTLTYRGDIMHDYETRILEPERLRTAYYYSLSALNALRSFSKSGDLDLENIRGWIPPLENNDYTNYKKFTRELQKSTRFLKILEARFKAENLNFTPLTKVCFCIMKKQ